MYRIYDLDAGQKPISHSGDEDIYFRHMGDLLTISVLRIHLASSHWLSCSCCDAIKVLYNATPVGLGGGNRCGRCADMLCITPVLCRASPVIGACL